MSRPIATTVLAVALLACPGAPGAPSTLSGREDLRQFPHDSGNRHAPAEYADPAGFPQCAAALGPRALGSEEQRAHLCEQPVIEPPER
ncbi:hypothetical protein [Saccharopolyspora flava]|uniref:hypothetical protein n=1 Tax=Saccharopolyspora flava TaxID=95161 RepID=UPI0011147EF3|nr:hypothetical protein [Saccharopolyspora flava]